VQHVRALGSYTKPWYVVCGRRVQRGVLRRYGIPRASSRHTATTPVATCRTLFQDGYDKDGNRIYDRVEGQTCHQCRQKTLGLRTSCSGCQSLQVGVQGG
jgi:Zinc-finger domain of monoamine-oxidase A repressor R1